MLILVGAVVMRITLKFIGVLLVIVAFSMMLSCGLTDSGSTYRLTTTANPEEGGSIEPASGKYDAGEQITLRAVPNQGWRFVGWEGDLVASSPQVNLTMTRDYTVIGNFEKREYPLNITAEGEGWVEEEVVAAKTYGYGTLVRLTGHPAEGWVFQNWSGDVSDDENPVEIVIDKEINIIALFGELPKVQIKKVQVDYNSTTVTALVEKEGADPVIERGVCYSDEKDFDIPINCISAGDGAGMFQVTISDLELDAVYYLRAYAKNSLGRAYSSEEMIETVTPKSGTADFTSYVAIGNSFTAGYSNDALYRDGQLHSFPKILAERMQQAGGGPFLQPLVNPGVGSNAEGQSMLVLKEVVGPDGTPMLTVIRAAEQGQDIFSQQIQGPFNNMGIPGARSFHLVTPGYGNLNPFFGRLMSDPQTTVLDDAMMADPTFFTLWIGNNDVLGYATSGGLGNGFSELGDPSAISSDDITPMNVFSGSVDDILGTLAASKAGGIVMSIPDLTSLPLFGTIPWNGLVLSAEQAQQLRNGYAAQGVPQALIPNFQAGQNGFIIADPDSPIGLRMAQQGELLLLSVPQDSLRNAGWGSLTPIPDQFTLRASQIGEVQQATDAFNAKLQEAANAFDFAFVDVNSLLEAAKTGLVFDGVQLNTDFVQGGIFSLDGIHFTPRGAALIANELIKTINDAYDSSLSTVHLNFYDGNLIP